MSTETPAGEPDTAEKDAAEADTTRTATTEVGAAGAGTDVSTADVGIVEAGAAASSPAEADTAEPGTTEPDTAEVKTTETGIAGADAAASSPAEAASAEAEPAIPGSISTRPVRPRPAAAARGGSWRYLRVALLAVAAVALLAAGVALRPVLIPESQASVLTPAEIGFTQDMAAHHEQALIMVQRLDPGVDPSIRRLAQQIADTQRMEIGTLLGWLRLANASPDSTHPMAWMNSAAGHHHSMAGMTATAAANGTTMPGMATQAELDALAAARGAAAETLFLQLMQRHHRGGVAMAQAADELIASGPVKEVARGMITSQSQEAGVMTLLLSQRGVQPLA